MIYREIRCRYCGKKLAEAEEFGFLGIKCPRCRQTNHFSFKKSECREHQAPKGSHECTRSNP